MAEIQVLGSAVRSAAALLTRARFLPLDQLGQWGHGAWQSIGQSNQTVYAVIAGAGEFAERARGSFPQLPRWPVPNIPLSGAPVLINAPAWGPIFAPLALLAMAAPNIGWEPIVLVGGAVAKEGHSRPVPDVQGPVATMATPVFQLLSEAAKRFGLPNPANIPAFTVPAGIGTTGQFWTRGCCKSCEQGLPCEDDCHDHVH